MAHDLKSFFYFYSQQFVGAQFWCQVVLSNTGSLEKKRTCVNILAKHKIRINMYISLQFLTEINTRGSKIANTFNRFHTHL